MADYNLKSITPDTTPADANMLFGADDQSSATPVPYTFAGIKTWVKGWITATDVGAMGFGGLVNKTYVFTDCLTTSAFSGTSDGPFVHLYSGTGGIVSQIPNPAGTFGVQSLDLGTTNTGRCAIMHGSLINILRSGAGQLSFQSKFAIHTLSTGTDTYTTRVGFIGLATGESNHGCFFRYTDGVNSGKWQAVVRYNNAETTYDTGITPVTDTFQKFKIVINAAGTSAVFSIDGTTVATGSGANMPVTSSGTLGYGAMSLKSVGTTATSGGYIDFMEVEAQFTTPR